MTARMLAAAVAAAALLPGAAADAACVGAVRCVDTCGQKVCVDRAVGFECTPSFQLVCKVRDVVFP